MRHDSEVRGQQDVPYQEADRGRPELDQDRPGPWTAVGDDPLDQRSTDQADRDLTDESQAGLGLTDESQADRDLTDESQAGLGLTDKSEADRDLTDQSQADREPADERLSDRQLADGRLAGQELDDERSDDREPADERLTDQESANERLAERERADGRLTDQESADGQRPDRELADGGLSDQAPVDQAPAVDEPMDEDSADRAPVGHAYSRDGAGPADAVGIAEVPSNGSTAQRSTGVDEPAGLTADSDRGDNDGRPEPAATSTQYASTTEYASAAAQPEAVTSADRESPHGSTDSGATDADSGSTAAGSGSTDVDSGSAGTGSGSAGADSGAADAESVAAASPMAVEGEPGGAGEGLKPGEATGGPGASGTTAAMWEQSAIDSYRERWRRVQVQFLDDPGAAADEADSLLTDVLDMLSGNLAARKRDLDQWRSQDHRDTEELRVTVRSYRDLLDRVLEM